jgi:hypothetical protein
MVQLGGKNSILIELGVPMNIDRLIEMCLNEIHSKVHKGKHSSDTFLFRMVENKEMLYHQYFSAVLYNIPLECPRKQGGAEIKWDT